MEATKVVKYLLFENKGPSDTKKLSPEGRMNFLGDSSRFSFQNSYVLYI